jgi:Domain of unknown function (DUF4190)/Prokaryotic RING finger family 1
MDAVQKLKANLKLEGKACGWCQRTLQLGEDAAICTACQKEHHGRCWETKAGCATSECVNAPLRRLDAPGAKAGAISAAPYVQELPPGLIACPGCRVPFAVGSHICPACRMITSPDGIYRGPKTNAPGAVQALVYGLVGLVFCGVILGPVAISKASTAKAAMASDPTLGGEGLATAGTVLGIIDLVLFFMYVMIRAGKS